MREDGDTIEKLRRDLEALKIRVYNGLSVTGLTNPIDEVVEIAIGGAIWQGSGTYASPTSGIKIIYNSDGVYPGGIGVFETWGGGVKQIYTAGSSLYSGEAPIGSLVSGDGFTTFTNDGIKFFKSSTSFVPGLQWWNVDGTEQIGNLQMNDNGATNRVMELKVGSAAATITSYMDLNVVANSMETMIYLQQKPTADQATTLIVMSVEGQEVLIARKTSVTLSVVPTLPTQTANTMFAGPTTGAAATPAFRALVAADMPAGIVDLTAVNFLVGTATALLSAEIVVGTTPGGELGGTWASPTVDTTHSGSAHHTQSHAMASASDHSAATLGDIVYSGAAGAWTLLTGNITTTRLFLTQTGTGAASAAPVWYDHEGAADPHSVYRLESADHSHQSTGLQAGQLDHGLALTGLTDDDHTQYVLRSVFTTLGDVAYGGAAGAWTRLAGNTVATRKFLIQLGTGAISAAPSWDTIADADVPATHAGSAHHAQAHILLSTDHSDTLAASVLDGSIIIGNVTPAWSSLVISIPAANVRNVLGVDNGELRPSWKTALDGTAPTTIAESAVAAAGTSLVFSHRDHTHGAPATWSATAHNLFSTKHGDTTGAASPVDGDIIIANVTPAWSKLAITIPAANVLNVLGVANGELRPSWKTVLDGTNPVDVDATAATPGTSLVFSHRDHRHLGHAAITLAASADTFLALTAQALSLDVQGANTGFWGPVSGVDAVPNFRAMDAADLPVGGNWNLTSDLTIEATTLFVGVTGGTYPGMVGIGTITPAAMLDLRGTISSASANARGLISAHTFSGAGAGPGEMSFEPTFSPSASIANAYGVVGVAKASPAIGVTITSMHSGFFRVDTGSTAGALTNGYGVTIASPSLGTLIPANVVGLWVQNQGAATMTASYGIYLSTQTGAATNWDLYFAGASSLGMGGTVSWKDPAGNVMATFVDLGTTGAINATGHFRVAGTQVVGARVVDARCDDVVDNTYGAEEAGVLDALRDAMITHGLIAAA